MNLNKKLIALSDRVLSDLQINTRTNLIGFFPCTGYVPQTCGISRNLRVGLPFYFDYTSVKNIDKHDILLFGEHSPNWKSPDGKEFLKNLVLSEKAKKYAIAEQTRLGTSWTNNWVFNLAPLFAGVYSTLIYVRQEWYYQQNKKAWLPGLRFVAAFGFAMVLYGFSFLLFSRMQDLLCNQQLDKLLEDLKGNQEYIDGGLEFYSKQQKRNQIHRTFFGSDGRFFFKTNGDVIKYFSAKYSVTEMIEKLSRIDRFDQSDGLSKVREEGDFAKVAL